MIRWRPSCSQAFWLDVALENRRRAPVGVHQPIEDPFARRYDAQGIVRIAMASDAQNSVGIRFEGLVARTAMSRGCRDPQPAPSRSYSLGHEIGQAHVRTQHRSRYVGCRHILLGEQLIEIEDGTQQSLA